MHSICLRRHTFASASEGFRLQLGGAFSHSSYPEHGLSPAPAMAELLSRLAESAEQYATLRRTADAHSYPGGAGREGAEDGFWGGAGSRGGLWRDSCASAEGELEALKNELDDRVNSRTCAGALVCRRDARAWHEAFPATVNHDEAVERIQEVAESAGLQVEMLEEPFRWSEDFSHYLQAYPGAFFGIGSGVDQPQLHNEYYDFPDELIPTGVKIYLAIVDSITATGADSAARSE